MLPGFGEQPGKWTILDHIARKSDLARRNPRSDDSVASRCNRDMLRSLGEFSLRQSDYNIKLVSAIGGWLKVKDEVKFSFDIVARKQA